MNIELLKTIGFHKSNKDKEISHTISRISTLTDNISFLLCLDLANILGQDSKRINNYMEQDNNYKSTVHHEVVKITSTIY